MQILSFIEKWLANPNHLHGVVTLPDSRLWAKFDSSLYTLQKCIVSRDER